MGWNQGFERVSDLAFERLGRATRCLCSHRCLQHNPVLFSRDGRWLAFGQESTTTLFELNEQGLHGAIALPAHRGSVVPVGFAADNRWLVTFGWTAVRIHPLDVNELSSRARKRVGRNLTDRERRIYLAD